MTRILVSKLHPTAHAYERADLRGIPPASFDEVLLRPHLVKPNMPGRGGSHVLIGRDLANRCLVIPISPAHHPDEWHAITVRRCIPTEERQLPR